MPVEFQLSFRSQRYIGRHATANFIRREFDLEGRIEMSTLDQLANLIHTKFDIETAKLDPNVPMSEFGLDSLTLAELIFMVEDEFHVDVPDARTDIATLTGLAALIDELKGAAPA
jgi:acyl carrier protein